MLKHIKDKHVSERELFFSTMKMRLCSRIKKKFKKNIRCVPEQMYFRVVHHPHVVEMDACTDRTPTRIFLLDLEPSVVDYL